MQCLDQHGRVQASVRPAEASADTTTWTLLGHDISDRSSHDHTLQAGQNLCVEVDLRDAFGNLAGDHACTGTASKFQMSSICMGLLRQCKVPRLSCRLDPIIIQGCLSMSSFPPPRPPVGLLLLTYSSNSALLLCHEVCMGLLLLTLPLLVLQWPAAPFFLQ